MKRPNMPVQGQGFVQPEINQNDILIRHKAESRIDSRVISERAGIQHESLCATIKKHQQQLRDLGALPRYSLKSGHKRGRPEMRYMLNEMQHDYLLRIVRGRNPEHMRHLKQDETKHRFHLLSVVQEIGISAFNEAIQNGMTPIEAVREVARRMETFASLMTSAPSLGVNHA